MMNITLKLLSLFILAGNICLKAQDITFIPQDTLLVDTLGSEIIFNISITNISSQEQIIFIKRTSNNLPSAWQSSLCFSLCFAPFVDSIVTSKDFGSSPLSPGENRIVSLHVFPQNNPGTAQIEIQAGTINNPTFLYTVSLSAVVNLTSINDVEPNLNDFLLSQNYPNPFNPSTKIQFVIPNEVRDLEDFSSQSEADPRNDNSLVSIKVYDVLGREVSNLVNEEKPAGSYEIEFNGYDLPSGIYFYRLSTSNFSLTRKMILEK